MTAPKREPFPRCRGFYRGCAISGLCLFVHVSDASAQQPPKTPIIALPAAVTTNPITAYALDSKSKSVAVQYMLARNAQNVLVLTAAGTKPASIVVNFNNKTGVPPTCSLKLRLTFTIKG